MMEKNERILKGKKIINSFANQLLNVELNESFDLAVNEILNCKGKIITTGMGKAGLVMRKFSSTLCSLGTSSCYLHPGEASHGDLGLLTEKDILFVASTSGKTREVIEIVNLAKMINCNPIICITSHKDSLIRDRSEIIIDMGEIKEEGHLSLAPTSSTIIMMSILDSIALIVSEEKNFTNLDFHKYHHSGYLGQISGSI